MTITCLHCGPIAVTDPAVILATRQVLSALAVGAAPLGAVTCPMCNDEVRSSAVRDDDDTYDGPDDGEAWSGGFAGNH